MRNSSFKYLFLLISFLPSCRQRHDIKQSDPMNEKIGKNDTIVKMENNSICLLVNLNGGSYFDFHLKEQPINPINWRAKKPEEKMFMGHFLCFDRWGPPSAAEKANGFLHHGEVNNVKWELLAPTETNKDGQTCSMMCTLPMAGLQLKRNVELSATEPVYFVTEEVKNLNRNGRIFNIVQHVSIAPPFLDRSTLFDNNTVMGFEDRGDGSLDQDDIVFKWPEADHNGEKISLRQFEGDWPGVSSFVYNENDKYGWVTACNPGKKLMLGYIWKTEDYPWINFWRSMENGVPMAFGMEFGTTGLHEPFTVVTRKGKIFNRNIYAFIDADEVISKSFTAFLAIIPEDYKGVDKIEINGSLLTIKEKNIVSRDIIYHIK